MQKKNKILLSLGTIGATALPIAAVVSCGGKSDWIRNDKAKLIKGNDLTVGDLVTHANNQIIKKTDDLSILTQQIAFYFYADEQKASIQVQKDAFAWEVHGYDKELTDLTQTTTSYNDILDKKAEVQKKIDKLKDITKINYESNSFASDFPQILLPLDVIQKRQSKIFDDQKNNFSSTFNTKQEGQATWTEELSKNYGGATNKTEAVDFLTFQQIKTFSELRNSVSVKTDYTVEQLKWANSNEGKEHYKFLKVDGWDATKFDAAKDADAFNQLLETADAYIRVTGGDDLDKLFFYGTNSKISEYKIVNKEAIDTALNNSGFTTNNQDKPLRLYRHILLNIRQNPDGRTLPWVATADLIKKLYSFTPSSTTSAPKHQFERIGDLFKINSQNDLFTDEVDDQTSFFLKQVSNNSDSTKTTGGSLGIKKATEYSDAMFDGFALGALATEENGFQKDSSDGFFTKLQGAVKNAYDETVGKTTLTDQETLTDTLDSIKDEDLIRIFGKKIRDALTTNKEKQIVYTDGYDSTKDVNRFAFISDNEKGGIHLIKKYSIGRDQLDGLIGSELEKMASANSTTKAVYNVASFMNPFLSQNNIIKHLTDPISTNQDYNDLKAWLIKRLDAKKFELDDSYTGDSNKKIDDMLANIQQELSKGKTLVSQELAQKISSGHKSYLVTKFDKREITQDMLKPEEIYSTAYELAIQEVSNV